MFTALPRRGFTSLVQQAARPRPAHHNLARRQRDQKHHAGGESGGNTRRVVASRDEPVPKTKKQNEGRHGGSEKITEAGRRAGPCGAPVGGLSRAGRMRSRRSRKKIIRGVVAQRFLSGDNSMRPG